MTSGDYLFSLGGERALKAFSQSCLHNHDVTLKIQTLKRNPFEGINGEREGGLSKEEDAKCKEVLIPRVPTPLILPLPNPKKRNLNLE